MVKRLVPSFLKGHSSLKIARRNSALSGFTIKYEADIFFFNCSIQLTDRMANSPEENFKCSEVLFRIGLEFSLLLSLLQGKESKVD